jgi:MinD superfamily P-loop ATPase
MESALALPEVNSDRCDGCGECVAVCHADALAVVSGTAAIRRPAACDYCTDCEVVCPVGAIRCPFEVVVA